MSNATQFIVEKLNNLREELSRSEGISDEQTIDEIYKIVMSKKFRKYAVTPEYQAHIKSAISKAVSQKMPVPFVWVFGGYKLWSLAEAPLVDWAELFSFVYFTEWLKPITALYKPGVQFDFFSDDVIVPLMNNVDPEDTNAYIKSFESLLTHIEPFLPQGFNFSLHRVIDQYNSFEEFKGELNNNIQELTAKRQKEERPLTPTQIAMIDLNVKHSTKQQVDPLWREKVQIIHDAYSMASKRRPYYRNPDKIMVINTPITGAIAIGTTKTSVVKFWVGLGALKKSGDSFQEYILSPKQIAVTKFREEKISTPGLDMKNFQRIKIYD